MAPAKAGGFVKKKINEKLHSLAQDVHLKPKDFGITHLKPTEMRRSFHPPTSLPILFSMDFWEVYMAFLQPRWIRCRDFSTRCRVTRRASL